jgi:hypothetical protein
MKFLMWTAGILLGALVVREGYLAFGPRRTRRRTLYNEALARSRATHKPLIVFGAPTQRVVQAVFHDYACGDLCIDEYGCPPCTSFIAGRPEDVLPRLGTASAVVFVSDALEYVDDIEGVVRELQRISGGDLYVSHTDPTTLAAWAWPGAHYRILQAPPSATTFAYKPLPWRGSTALRLVELPVVALPPTTPPIDPTGTIPTTGETLP